LISTSVEKVYRNYNRPNVQPIDQMNLAEARELLRDGQFPAGSMGPKIEAAIRFIDKGGELVIIAHPTKIAGAIQGESGTRIVRKI
jgi:carbamate kinase